VVGADLVREKYCWRVADKAGETMKSLKIKKEKS
jgi:hypothetical protein